MDLTVTGGVAGRLIKGSAWIGAARILAHLFTLVSLLVVARLLIPDDFGLVALATTILAIVTALTEVSMNSAVVRHPAPTEVHLSTAWTLSTIRGALIFAAFAAASVPVAILYDEPRLPPVMMALGASALLAGLMNPRRAMMQRDLVFWQEFVLNVVQQLVAAGVSIAVAIAFRSHWALVGGVVAGQLVATAISYAIAPFRPRLTLSAARELLSFSIWLTAAQIVTTLNLRFDQLLIGKVVGMGALGFYSFGSNLALLPTRELTAPLLHPTLAGFARIAGDTSRLAAGYQRAQTLVTAIALPAGIGLALIADPLMRLTVGDQWVPAIFIVQALAAVVAIQTMGSLVPSLGMALGETRLLFMRSLQLLVVRLPVIVLGLYLDGLRGVVIARIVTGLAGLGVDLLLVRRFTGLTLSSQLGANARALTAVAVMALGAGLLGYLPWPHDAWGDAQQIVVTVVTGAGLYIATTAALWGMMGLPAGPESEAMMLLGKIVRMPAAIARRAG